MAYRAFILANGTFSDAEIPALRSPLPDGQRLKQLLERPDVQPYVVTLCSDLSSVEAREALQCFCLDAEYQDQLLIFISGHGLKDTSGKLYFAMRDTKKARLKATALEARFIVECMEESPAPRQLLFLDTCYSGAFARGVTHKGEAVAVARDDFEGDWTGRAVLTATTAVQLAAEIEVDGYVQSRFTRHLMNGIASGDADRHGEGQIFLGDLFDYVRSALKADGADQRPEIFAEKQSAGIVVARNPAPRQPLPPGLLKKLQSAAPIERASAVELLVALAAAGGHPLAEQARMSLSDLLEDDSLTVRRVATSGIERLDQSLSTTPKQPTADLSASHMPSSAAPNNAITLGELVSPAPTHPVDFDEDPRVDVRPQELLPNHLPFTRGQRQSGIAITVLAVGLTAYLAVSFWPSPEPQTSTGDPSVQATLAANTASTSDLHAEVGATSPSGANSGMPGPSPAPSRNPAAAKPLDPSPIPATIEIEASAPASVETVDGSNVFRNTIVLRRTYLSHNNGTWTEYVRGADGFIPPGPNGPPLHYYREIGRATSSIVLHDSQRNHDLRIRLLPWDDFEP
jgi:hypothetical protein